MSTKAIEALIERVRSGEPLWARDTDAAEREAKAIRKAAKVIATWPGVVLLPGASEEANAAAHNLMISIAKEET
jgi:hypothetical protein